MMLDGFDFIGSDRTTGDIILMKDKYKIWYKPSLIPTTKMFVSVTNSEDLLSSETFPSLERAIKFVNDSLSGK